MAVMAVMGASIVTKTAPVQLPGWAPIGPGQLAPVVIGHGRGDPCDSPL